MYIVVNSWKYIFFSKGTWKFKRDLIFSEVKKLINKSSPKAEPLGTPCKFNLDFRGLTIESS